MQLTYIANTVIDFKELTMIHSVQRSSNHLLASLPDMAWDQWQPQLKMVPLQAGQVLVESGEKVSHVYFPVNSVVSLLYVTEDGSYSETAAIGNDGMVGISLFTGGDSTPTSSVVQTAGYGFKLEASAFKAEVRRSENLYNLLLKYSQALMTQVAQRSVCNRHHSIEQQLCRFLLTNLDKIQSDDLQLTHELIANMLGVRREGITLAALRLQQSGVIQYSRGVIKVLDRPRMQEQACECYRVCKNEYSRLLPALM
jgi:CRP-like cAMP-binding protein